MCSEKSGEGSCPLPVYVQSSTRMLCSTIITLKLLSWRGTIIKETWSSTRSPTHMHAGLMLTYLTFISITINGCFREMLHTLYHPHAHSRRLCSLRCAHVLVQEVWRGGHKGQCRDGRLVPLPYEHLFWGENISSMHSVWRILLGL